MDEAREGTVVRVHGLNCVVDADGREYECTPRGLLKKGRRRLAHPLAVGDRVRWSACGPREQAAGRADGPTPDRRAVGRNASPAGAAAPAARGVIDEVLPRRTVLAKRAARNPRRQQIVAVNVEQLLIVASLADPPLKLYQIDRLLVAAQVSGLDPALVLNKTDLPDDDGLRDATREVYARLALPIFPAAAALGRGLEPIAAWLAGRTSVVAGPSGAGKSTILNAFLDAALLPTDPVNRKTGYGRHTTTAVSLERLRGGGYVIDTPGVREFECFAVDTRTLSYHYPDMVEWARRCRFNDCRHVDEPGCAVRPAVTAGNIHPARYRTYCYLLERYAEVDQELAGG